MTIGERIKTIRTKNGFGQTDVAIKAGITKQSLYKYENGIIENIPSDKIEAIAKALNVSPAELMGWENEKPPVNDEELLDEELIRRLCSLSPDEMQKVDAFVQGLLANR